GPEFVLQNDDVLAPEAYNDIHLATGLLETDCGGQGDGAADTAAHYANPLYPLGVGGLAQRTDEVLNVVSFVQRAQGVGGKAHFLEDDGDGALFPVIPGDGQRDPLSLLVHPENDELTGFGLFGDEGGLNFHQSDGRIQLFFSDNLIHNPDPFIPGFW